MIVKVAIFDMPQKARKNNNVHWNRRLVCEISECHIQGFMGQRLRPHLHNLRQCSASVGVHHPMIL